MTGVELGLYVSFSGIITFKKTDQLKAIAAEIPADRILIETDAPFLAPAPHRGKRNEPAFVAGIAQVLSEVRGATAGRIADQTTENFFRLFTKVAQD
jgi:TatD DNase family protein